VIEPAADAPNPELEARQSAERLVTEWLQKLDDHAKDFSDFDADRKTAIKIIGLNRKASERGTRRRFEIAWANREIIQTATYERAPKSVVQSRYLQGKPLPRAISEVMERATNTTIDLSDVHSALLQARNDLVDFSRGVVWCRYEADLAPAMQDPATGEMIEVKTGERALVDWVASTDFAHGDAKVWKDVPWVARRVWRRLAEWKKKYPDYAEEMAAGVVTTDKASDKAKDQGPTGMVGVWEIWCAESRKVYFISDCCRVPLSVSDWFLDLSTKFPCPEPAYSTLRRDTLIPIPDCIFYKSQIEEINHLTGRVHALSDALKVRGFYNAANSNDGAQAIEAALASTDDRKVMIPVPNWAGMTGEKGNGITWMPIDMVVTVLRECIATRRQLIDDVYQISGISDVLRGSSQASETATAQSIKAKWGSVRMRNKQSEMERLARDVCRIIGEIIAENFSAETLAEMTQFNPAETKSVDGQSVPLDWDTLMAALKSDRLRSFLVSVETNSTVEQDDAQMQQARVLFVQTMGQFLTQSAPLVQAQPMLAPVIAESLKFAARGFRIGRDLEQVIDDTMTQIVQMATAPQEPQEEKPDPEIELKRAELLLKRDVAKAEIELKREIAAADRDAKAEAEIARIADQREGREATLKATERPALSMQVDAQDAIGQVAQQLQAMAMEQSDAVQVAVQQLQASNDTMAQAVAAIAMAVEKLGAPRRKSITGSNGKTYDMIDEAV
jgi:hypothetical protein